MQLSTNKDKNKNKIMFLKKKKKILGLLGFFVVVVEVRSFIVVVLKSLAFSTSKSYFIYFTTLLYNTSNIKCSIFFLSLHLE